MPLSEYRTQRADDAEASDGELIQMGKRILLETDLRRAQQQKHVKQLDAISQHPPQALPMPAALELLPGFKQQQDASMPNVEAERMHRRSITDGIEGRFSADGGKRTSLEETTTRETTAEGPAVIIPAFAAREKLPPIPRFDATESTLTQVEKERDLAVVTAALDMLKRQPSLKGLKVPTEAHVRRSFWPRTRTRTRSPIRVKSVVCERRHAATPAFVPIA